MKAIIYLRTSTTEQHPEKQKQDCLAFAQARGYEVIDIVSEQLSGFKDIKRPIYEEVKARAYKGEIQAVIVWAFDRWVRNRDTLLEDVTTLRNYGCKLHSVNDAWLEAINIEGSLGKTIQEFLLGMVGCIAQMESERKSQRTKMAYENKKGRWGRKELPQSVVDSVLNMSNNGYSVRKIAEQVFYWDKNNNKHGVSKSAVHKIIADFKAQNKQELNRIEAVQL